MGVSLPLVDAPRGRQLSKKKRAVWQNQGGRHSTKALAPIRKRLDDELAAHKPD